MSSLYRKITHTPEKLSDLFSYVSGITLTLLTSLSAKEVAENTIVVHYGQLLTYSDATWWATERICRKLISKVTNTSFCVSTLPGI